MSSNGLPRNYYGVLKEHLIAHVLRKQNEGSTPIQNLLYMVFVVQKPLYISSQSYKQNVQWYAIFMLNHIQTQNSLCSVFLFLNIKANMHHQYKLWLTQIIVSLFISMITMDSNPLTLLPYLNLLLSVTTLCLAMS